jgi:hypothetical protein
MLLYSGRCAAWIPDAALVREERSLEISVLQQEAHIRMRSRFHNSTQETTVVRSWMPFSDTAQEIHIFANAEGSSFVEFTEQARLDALADAAEKEQDVRFFRLAESPWTRVFRTEDILVKGDESLELVWEWTLPVEQQSDFDGIEIFLNDGVSDGIFQVEFSLALANPLQHFWSPFLAESIINRSELGMVALQQRSEFLAEENFRVLWSEKENPRAEFYADGYMYIGHFRPLPPPQEFQNVTILLDASGSMSDVWLHVQELLRFLLEHQENRLFRVAITYSDSMEWIVGGEELFEENTSALRQKILETVAWKSPFGKGNISEILPQMGQPQEKHLLIVFSDEETIIQPNNSAPVAVLQFFSLEESSAWKELAMATRGVVQKAFRSIMGTYEAEELLHSVESLRESLPASDILSQEGEEEIFPSQLVPQFSSVSPVFVGRKSVELQINVGNTWFEWLPKYWATMNIAQKLEKGQREKSFSIDTLDAILAVARTFGVRTSLFTSETTRNQLQKSLLEQNIWGIVENLWKENMFFSDSKIHVIDGVPLWYESDDVWRTFDFRERVIPERWVKIAPFSAAQRQLFVLFPEIFAEPFGVGTNVEFCTLFRCFSVVSGGRENALPSDRAFVRDFDPYHWAIPFVVDLVGKGILEPELNGKLHLDRSISRGEFVEMLVLDMYGSHFSRTYSSVEFTDLHSGDSFFDTVQFLTKKGVIRGYEDGSFRTMQDLSRAEAVKILLATEGIIPTKVEVAVAPMFSDTTGWERPWVEEAARRGIVQGYEDGTFHPQAALTRAEAAKVIVQSRK